MYRNGRTVRTGGQYYRQLYVELLERRDLLAVIRLVDWNTFNRPNDETDDANFLTILQAIGNETVQGNTKRLDILALQETDPPVTGTDSIGHVESILDSLYPSTNYGSIISSSDGGGDCTGFVWDTSTVTFLNSTELGAPLTHRILRAKFRPADSIGDSSDFYVYSVHLKSGSTGPIAATRASEAAILRADADSLGEGAQVLMVGDFNMAGSSEAAYTNLVAAGAGQLQDVADAAGTWFNQQEFLSLHSHDVNAMNDRFDIHFASGEFFNGIALEYVLDSFHVFGNTGTHMLGGSILPEGSSDPVLTALSQASDHLPVIADYQFVPSTPNIRITETGGLTKVVEGGLFDTYSVVLDTVPSANVMVDVKPDSQLDVGSGAGMIKTLTFTPANALTPQFVVVHADDDADPEGDHTGMIMHTSVSADPAYNARPIAIVNVTIVDNDAPKIVINEIDSDQTGTDAAEFVELYDGGVGNASLTGKYVVFFNGSNDQAYAVFDLTGKSTNADGFFVLGNSGVPGVSPDGIQFAGNFLQNGADAVMLYAGAFPLNGAVGTVDLNKVLDAIVYGTNDSDDAGLLVLLNANQPQANESDPTLSAGEVQSLSRVPDGGNPRETSGYKSKTPTPNTFNSPPPIPGVLITQSDSRLDVAEGGVSDSYQIALLTIPTSDVTLTIDPDTQTSLGPGAAIMLMFTPADALIPKTVTVNAVDDDDIEGTHTSVIATTATSADSAYNGIAIAKVIANIVDNDAPAPTNVVITEIMYNPDTPEPDREWIEIFNAGTGPVNLGGWQFDDEDGTNWGAVPNGTILNPNQIAVFFDVEYFQPDDAMTAANKFRMEWSVPASALVIGIPWGTLANTPNANPSNPPLNEVLQLKDNHGIQMDVVNYDDVSPWPANTNGLSIYLKNASLDNNSGASWAQSTVGVAGAISPAGPKYLPPDVGSPGRYLVAGDYNGNGVVDAADYTVWRDTLGSMTDLRADGSGPTPGVPNSLVDQPDYTFWKSNFGVSPGSGGNSLAGGGGSSVEIVAATAPALSSAPANNLAIDAAVADFAPAPVLQSLVIAAKPSLRPHSRFIVPASDLLLLAARHSSSTREAANAPLMHSTSATDDSQFVDEFCMSLGARERADRGLLHRL